MFLTDDEFEELQNMEFSQNDWLWFYTQAVENKLLEKLKAQEPFAYFSINDYGAWEETSDPTAFALYEHHDPRVAELEAVLKIALKQLEEWEVKIDHEFGDCRQLDAIEAAGDLSEATVAVRAAMKEMK